MVARPAEHQLRQWTERFRPGTRDHYPQCQHHDVKRQCEKSVYADGRCWEHQKAQRT